MASIKKILPALCILAACALALAAQPAEAGSKAEWVDLTLKDGSTVRALYGDPEGPGPHKAVIYNHGTFVRKMGHRPAARSGYDVKKFVRELNELGYAAIAPVRETGRFSNPEKQRRQIMRGPAEEWDAAVEEGIMATEAAIEFLRERGALGIGLVGFSEGGNVSLWASLGNGEISALVLMSPATLGKSTRYRLKSATGRLSELEAPVLITAGKKDLKQIRMVLQNHIIPALQELGKQHDQRLDYPGDHEWFWKVRDRYWKDVAGFLEDNL